MLTDCFILQVKYFVNDSAMCNIPWLLNLSSTFGLIKDVIIILFYVLGLIGLIVGAAGDSWRENDYMVIGLYSYRNNHRYGLKITRYDVLKFGENTPLG